MELIILPVVTTIVLILRILVSYKNPPYTTGDRRSGDIIYVCTWELRKGGGFYRKYIFSKRKSGRFGVKYSAFDLFCILVPLMGITAGFGLITYYNLEDMIQSPEIWIPALIVFFIAAAQLYAVAIFSLIEAQIQLRKYIRKHS